MTTIGAVIISRNDDYGQNLIERGTYCLNSFIDEVDEVIYVDWNSPEGKQNLALDMPYLQKSPKFKYITISKEQAEEWTSHDPDAQVCSEVLARNIGLRRLSTDLLISSNIDMICPRRYRIEENIVSNGVFYTTGMRNISLYTIREWGGVTELEKIREGLDREEPTWGQEPVVQTMAGDVYSLVSHCGSFQIAHKDIWYKIRGFEERLYKRAYTDTNILRKASWHGYSIDVAWKLPVWHIGHEAGFGGYGGFNDMMESVFMEGTTNPETWGHSDVNLEMGQIL